MILYYNHTAREIVTALVGTDNPVLGVKDPFFAEDDVTERALHELLAGRGPADLIMPTGAATMAQVTKVGQDVKAIRSSWEAAPDQRLGQLLVNYY